MTYSASSTARTARISSEVHLKLQVPAIEILECRLAFRVVHVKVNVSDLHIFTQGIHRNDT